MTTRIAMWSGPRNISTALMRSFGARSDTAVSDEPLYAHYLSHTGFAHPGADEITRVHETDWRSVVAELTGPVPGDRELWYQKQMAHHLLPHIEREWLDGCVNTFLIREPRAMLTSLLEKLDKVRIEDTGLPQQVELFRWVQERSGETPAVLDAREVLMDPRSVLGAFCARIGIEFDAAMLSWEPGLRTTDGCWAPYWYGNTLKSTGFAPYRVKQTEVPAAYEELARECEELYAEIAAHRIRAKLEEAR